MDAHSCTCNENCFQAVTPLSTPWFIVLHATSPKTGFLQPLAAAAVFAAPQSSEKLFCSNIYTFADSPPCRSLTIFDLGIELTANQCQSVCRPFLTTWNTPRRAEHSEMSKLGKTSSQSLSVSLLSLSLSLCVY